MYVTRGLSPTHILHMVTYMRNSKALGLVFILVICLSLAVQVQAAEAYRYRPRRRPQRPRPTSISLTAVKTSEHREGNMLTVTVRIQGRVNGGTGRVSLYVSRVGSVTLRTGSDGTFSHTVSFRKHIRQPSMRVFISARFWGSRTAYPSSARTVIRI